MTQRDILVTNALPFANGPIHLGHMLGYVQADIWVRFQRLQGHRAGAQPRFKLTENIGNSW